MKQLFVSLVCQLNIAISTLSLACGAVSQLTRMFTF